MPTRNQIDLKASFSAHSSGNPANQASGIKSSVPERIYGPPHATSSVKDSILHRQDHTELCVAAHHSRVTSAAFTSGYFSIIGRTPVSSAKRSVSSESVGVPEDHP